MRICNVCDKEIIKSYSETDTVCYECQTNIYDSEDDEHYRSLDLEEFESLNNKNYLL